MFLPATDDDLPGLVTLMNRAYRGAGAAGWSTRERYLSGDRITEDVLRADLLAKPHASLLKWKDPEGGPVLGCVWIESLGDDGWYLEHFPLRLHRILRRRDSWRILAG
jgi:hypothetical protein